MIRKLSLILLIALVAANAATAQSTVGDLYRTAGRTIPAPANAAEKNLQRDALGVPLDDAAQHYFERAIKVLELFDSASELPFSDWGFSPDDPASAGRTIPNASELTNLVALRARLRADKGQFKPALQDCYNLAQLARRLSVQPSLPRQEQQNILFNKAIQTVAFLMPQLPSDDVENFLKGIDGLRAPVEPLEVVRTTKTAYLWYYGKLIENVGLRTLASRSNGELGDLFGVNHAEPVNVWSLARDPEQAQVVMAETASTFDQMIAALNLSSAPDRRRAVEQIRIRTGDAHALIRGVSEITEESLRLQREHRIMLDMAHIAVAILGDHTQPIDNEAARQQALPYEFVSESPTSFTLRWSSDQPPIELHVGPRTSGPATQPH